MVKQISVIWKNSAAGGWVDVKNGMLVKLGIEDGTGNISGSGYHLDKAPYRLEMTIEGDYEEVTYGGTLITVNNYVNPFSFRFSDADREYPVYIPGYQVIVTVSGDKRTYADIEDSIKKLDLKSEFHVIESDAEETCQNAELNTRNLKCMTWLGLSRNFRLFHVGFREDGHDKGNKWDYVIPKYHFSDVRIPEFNNEAAVYTFLIGRGLSCAQNIERTLLDGYLPILKSRIYDGDILYDSIAFAVTARGDFTADNLKGTHYLVADGHAAGHMFTEGQQQMFDLLEDMEMEDGEEVVLCYRVEASNVTMAPCYAHFRVPMPARDIGFPDKAGYHFDIARGIGIFPSNKVFCVARINGKPLDQEEFSVCLKPGRKAVFEFFIPHKPIRIEDAEDLIKLDFNIKLEECRKFWISRLEAGARLDIPEKRIDNMVKAGICHIEIASYGTEPGGSVTPTTGVYSAIGSESAPIILFMDSMGYHDTARRMLQFFFDKQHEDGFIQNFGGYMLETGPVLWCAGEHFRYTGDRKWAVKVAPKLIKACDYIIDWRNRNRKDELKGRGFAMIDGKVGDPQDDYHSFMLNGYAYLGMARVAEILDAIGHCGAERIKSEANEYKLSIRDSFFDTLRRAPVIPLSDGSWCPSAAPWPENSAPVLFHMEGGKWLTHGALTCRDSLVGPLYLAFQEVLDCNEQAVSFMLDSHAKYMCIRNVAFSQPYYSRHDFIHLKRGDVKAFLKTYYNSFTGLADRETYTFWEHYFHASPHKTHEEAWFLMQTRWMLYMEDEKCFKLLPAIPRAWMADGCEIRLENAASYFGRFSLYVKSDINKGKITAEIRLDPDRKPAAAGVRLPHPAGKHGIRVEGGIYNPDTETVWIDPCSFYNRIVLEFPGE